MRPTTQLDRGIPGFNDADDVAIFISDERDDPGFVGFFLRRLLGPDRMIALLEAAAADAAERTAVITPEGAPSYGEKADWYARIAD